MLIKQIVFDRHTIIRKHESSSEDKRKWEVIFDNGSATNVKNRWTSTGTDSRVNRLAISRHKLR